MARRNLRRIGASPIESLNEHVEDAGVVAFDGACLRGKCDTDPALGYALMQRVSQVMYERLQASRVQLLDMYGAPT